MLIFLGYFGKDNWVLLIHKSTEGKIQVSVFLIAFMNTLIHCAIIY